MNSWEAEQLERLKKDYEKQERELKEKLAKKKAKLDAATRRLRARAAATERKQDTRRKILAGAWVLARAAQDPEASRQLTQGLDGFLERDRDRALVHPWTQAHRRRISQPGESDASSRVGSGSDVRSQDILQGIRVLLVTGVPGQPRPPSGAQ